MDIGGFQKNSLIDFPGTIACVIFTQGCNFFCPYCHNPGLVPRSSKRAGDLFDADRILKFLEKRKGLLEGVVITGGEPTLQKDLREFIKEIKTLGYKVKLDTNGSHPDILNQLIRNRLLDFISMDIKTSMENYHLVMPGKIDKNKILQSARMLMDHAPAYEFRTTCVRPFITRDIMDIIGKMISGASRYVLQKCSDNVKILDPKFLKKENNFFNEKEMAGLKMILDPHVITTIVR